MAILTAYEKRDGSDGFTGVSGFGSAMSWVDRIRRVFAVAMVLSVISPGVQAQSRDGDETEEQRRQPFVNEIIFVGNNFFSKKELKKQMSTRESSFFSISKPRLDEAILRRDIAAVEAFYHANGFLDATVTLQEIRQLEERRFVDIVIAVSEREATRVRSIAILDAGPLEESDLRKDLLLEPGVPFSPAKMVADLKSIELKYHEEGYLAVEVADSVRVEGKQVDIGYRIEPGPIISIRAIEITGNKLTKQSIIEKEFVFKAGERFKLSKVLETQRNLYETGLFTTVDILRDAPNLSHRFVDIVVRVRERKSRYIEAGFGVGNVVGSRVLAEWGDRNVFGTGRLLRLRAEYSFALFEDVGSFNFRRTDARLKYYRYDAQFNQRRIFGTKVLLGISGYIEKDETVEGISIRTRGASLGGRRHLGTSSDVFLALSQERINRISPDDNRNSTTNRISPAVSQDTRDFILDPKRGEYRDLQLDIAGGILQGDNDFYKITSSVQKYYDIGGGVTLAVRARVGFADAFGGSVESGVPVEERFFTGGSNSVRGYAENTLAPFRVDTTVVDSFPQTTRVVLGGRALLLTNAEVRFPLPLLARYRFSGALFMDGGNVWSRLKSLKTANFRLTAGPDEVSQADYRYTVGFGLRYNTPVGPIRLDYGWLLKRENGVDNARFHISLGQIF